MEERPHALLLKFPGTNCDAETARALEMVGFSTAVVPITQIDRKQLKGAALVVLSGGFSYGDYVMAGRLAQLVTEQKIGNALKEFRDDGGYLLGICNGFQILTKLGLLPPGSLIHNESGRYQCQWAKLERKVDSNPFLSMLPREFEFPVAHAEGRFVTATPEEAEVYKVQGLAPLIYADNLNGSAAQIAGMQDSSGRVLGLMPHPERFMFRENHYDPDWDGDAEHGWGWHFFRSIYEEIAAKEVVPARE